jgi:hypothetical protein
MPKIKDLVKLPSNKKISKHLEKADSMISLVDSGEYGIGDVVVIVHKRVNGKPTVYETRELNDNDFVDSVLINDDVV